MTEVATAMLCTASLLLAPFAFAADRVPVCYWGGLLRDCKTGCIEGRTTDRCSGLTLARSHRKRAK